MITLGAAVLAIRVVFAVTGVGLIPTIAAFTCGGAVLAGGIGLFMRSSVSPVFEKPAGTSKSPAGTKTGDKYASGGPGRPGPP